MLVKSYFKKTADILTWKEMTPELLRTVNSFYIKPPEGKTKVELQLMPKMVCMNAIHQLYENINSCGIPELLAELKIKELAPTGNYSEYSHGNLPAGETFHYSPRFPYFQSIIVSAVWYIFANADTPNPDLLLILSDAAKNADNITFTQFKKLYDEQHTKTTPQAIEQANAAYIPQYHIADKRKADVMKVFYYMYQLKMFTNPDGTPAKGTKKFMQDIGNFYGEDFTNYAQHISKAKEMDTYMNIFNDLEKVANKDYLS